MPDNPTPWWWTAMALLSVVIGPLFLVLRLDDASQLERFIYITLVFPLGLILLPIRHAVLKKSIQREPDSQLRQVRFEEVRREFRLLMSAIIPASIIGVTVAAWLLFYRVPGPE